MFFVFKCQILFRKSFAALRFAAERLRRCVQQLEHVVDDAPQAALQRKVVVHQVDQEVVIVDVLDDHP